MIKWFKNRFCKHKKFKVAYTPVVIKITTCSKCNKIIKKEVIK